LLVVGCLLFVTRGLTPRRCRTNNQQPATNHHDRYNTHVTIKGIVQAIFRGEGKMLQPGQQAPDFDVVDHEGNRVRLQDLRGKKVVLWFYPKADTPG
jgi:cytochrome oxidase Cu insertion factor (SCO1/SenC/PrrC family)